MVLKEEGERVMKKLIRMIALVVVGALSFATCGVTTVQAMEQKKAVRKKAAGKKPKAKTAGPKKRPTIPMQLRRNTRQINKLKKAMKKLTKRVNALEGKKPGAKAAKKKPAKKAAKKPIKKAAGAKAAKVKAAE